MQSSPQQLQLFKGTSLPPAVAPLPMQRHAPAYVWPSAVEEWETIYRRLHAIGVPAIELEERTNRAFCQADPYRRCGGLFPRRKEVRHG